MATCKGCLLVQNVPDTHVGQAAAQTFTGARLIANYVLSTHIRVIVQSLQCPTIRNVRHIGWWKQGESFGPPDNTVNVLIEVFMHYTG